MSGIQGKLINSREDALRVEIVIPSTTTVTDTGTETTTNDSATSVSIAASNAARTGAVIRNTSTSRLYLGFGFPATTTSTYFLDQNDIVELPLLAGGKPFRGQVNGIWTSVAGGTSVVTEFTK